MKKLYIMTIQEKIKKYADLKEKSIERFFKAVIGLSKKEYSDKEKNIRNKSIRVFNRLTGSNFYIVWEKIGTADLYTIKKIQYTAGNNKQLTLDLQLH